MNEPGVVLLDFRALLEAAPDGIAVVDERGRILVVNDQFCALFGYEADQLVNQPIGMLIPERLRDIHAEHRRRYVEHPSKRAMGLGLELVGVRKDGGEVPVEISLSPVTSGGQTFTIAVVRDVSERKRLQDEREELRSALDTERERYRIGMDLHDGVMQDIYAVTLGLDLVAEDVDIDTAIAKDGVLRSINQLHNVIRDIRSFIFELRPRQFDGDLRQALLDLGNEFEQNSGIETNILVSADLPDIEQQVALGLYLITHEALSNTRKHAHASKVDIGLNADDGILRLEIRDNGRGFDTSVTAGEGHRGLRNIRNRVASAGASLQIISAPGQGTVVRVEISVPPT